MPDIIASLKLKVLSDISRIMDQALDLDYALGQVLGCMSESLAMNRATLTLMDSITKRLTIRASYGLSPEEVSRGVYQLDEGITGRIFQTGVPCFIPDVSKEPLFLNKTRSRCIDKEKIVFIGVPITLAGKVIGVLNVDRLFGDDVSFEEDVEFLQVVATLVAQFVSIYEKVSDHLRILKRENVTLRSQLSQKTKGLYMVGHSKAVAKVQEQLEKAAPTRATVLLLGESGVGKTLTAKIIHELSDRREFPFIKINCASIPDNLLESELFGHDKGAFTGAVSTRSGRLEDAHRGTAFLDEIGELPLAMQAKLLHFLQDREIVRLGGSRAIQVNVRVIAATNRNLADAVVAGTFRADLYYRLNVLPINVPSLKERREDIPLLLNHFLRQFSAEYNRALYLSSEAVDRLQRYDWPGNVREMHNLIERLTILAASERIDRDLVDQYIGGDVQSVEVTEFREPPDGSSLAEMEKQKILSALSQNNWIQRQAAKQLGISPRQIGYKIDKYGFAELVAKCRATSMHKYKIGNI